MATPRLRRKFRLKPIFSKTEEPTGQKTQPVAPSPNVAQNLTHKQITPPNVLEVLKSASLVNSDSRKTVSKTVTSFSLKSLANSDDAIKNVKETHNQEHVETVPSTRVDVAKHITREELVAAWRTFAENLPHSDIAISQRLVIIEPNLISNTEFEVVAENPTVEKLLNSLSQRIVPFIKQQMNCSELKMSVKLRDVADRPVMLSLGEQFAQMRTDNPAFAKLAENLNLVL